MTDKESRTMDIGQKILEIRKAEGLSQTEFAEKFHVTSCHEADGFQLGEW